MHQPLVLEGVGRADALAVKAREQRGGAGSVKTFVVVEDAQVQTIRPSVESPSLQHSRKCRTICRAPPYHAASITNRSQRRSMTEPSPTEPSNLSPSGSELPPNSLFFGPHGLRPFWGLLLYLAILLTPVFLFSV